MGTLFVLKLQVGDLDFIPELYCEKGGISFEGDSLKQTTFTTVQACKEECANTKGCAVFVANHATLKTCDLQGNDHGGEKSSEGVTSGRMSCYEDHYCWKKGFRFLAASIKNIPFTTVEACIEECAKTEGCLVFEAAAGTNNRCWLKNKDSGEEKCSIVTAVRMSCYEDHYCSKKGFKLLGGNFKNIPFTTVQACKEECAKTEGCTAFTTVAGTVNECRLKNKDHGAESADPNSISARMSCYEDHHCWKKGISLPGGVIKNIPFTTVEACKEECAKTEGCVAFATNAGAVNECRLKNKDHGAESAGPNSISARMSCYEDHYCLKKGFGLKTGGIIKSIPFTTVEACKEECAKTEGCVVFTTTAGTVNECRLKNKDHGAEYAGGFHITAFMSCYAGNN